MEWCIGMKRKEVDRDSLLSSETIGDFRRRGELLPVKKVKDYKKRKDYGQSWGEKGGKKGSNLFSVHDEYPEEDMDEEALNIEEISGDEDSFMDDIPEEDTPTDEELFDMETEGDALQDDDEEAEDIEEVRKRDAEKSTAPVRRDYRENRNDKRGGKGGISSGNNTRTFRNKEGEGRWKRRLRSESHGLKPTCHIGKNGLTASIISEVKAQCRKRRVVKVRLLPTALEDAGRRELAEELSRRTGLALVELKGNVITLSKRR